MTADLEARIRRLEDIEEIRQLKARYCATCDDDHNPDNMIKLFVPDGIWDSPGMATCHGHDEIYKFMDDLGKSGRIRNSAHMVMNPEIKIDGDTATGGWRFLMMYTGNAPDGTIQFHRIIGTYEDKFVRTDAGWRFTSLRPLVEETDAYTVEPSKFDQAS